MEAIPKTTILKNRQKQLSFFRMNRLKTKKTEAEAEDLIQTIHILTLKTVTEDHEVNTPMNFIMITSLLKAKDQTFNHLFTIVQQYAKLLQIIFSSSSQIYIQISQMHKSLKCNRETFFNKTMCSNPVIPLTLHKKMTHNFDSLEKKVY